MSYKLNRCNSTIIALLIAGVMIFSSCDYREHADAEYPEQIVYLPAAAYNVYEINKVTSKSNAHPTPGDRRRYIIDGAAGKFLIPLSVYRAGIDTKGTFDVQISANPDTLTAMLDAGTLEPNVHVLSSETYTHPSVVTVKDGDTHGYFDVEVDLAFLSERRQNAPDEKFAVAISIESGARATNPLLSTVLIVINTETVAQ